MSIWAKTWAYEQHPKRVEDDVVTEKKHPAAKAVLVALAEYPGPGQRQCWPSQKTLADMTDYSERQVRACLSDLEKQVLIRRTERKRKDGTRRSDMIELLGPIECFGPPQDEDHQPEESSGCAEESSGGTRKRVPGMNRKKEPSSSYSRRDARQAAASQKGNPIKVLIDGLEAQEVYLSEDDKKKYSIQLGQLKKKEVDEAKILRAVYRVVSDWPTYPYTSLQKALSFTDGNVATLKPARPEPTEPYSVRV